MHALDILTNNTVMKLFSKFFKDKMWSDCKIKTIKLRIGCKTNLLIFLSEQIIYFSTNERLRVKISSLNHKSPKGGRDCFPQDDPEHIPRGVAPNLLDPGYNAWLITPIPKQNGVGGIVRRDSIDWSSLDNICTERCLWWLKCII